MFFTTHQNMNQLSKVLSFTPKHILRLVLFAENEDREAFAHKYASKADVFPLEQLGHLYNDRPFRFG